VPDLERLRTAWASASAESDQALKKAILANQKQIDQVAARKRRSDELSTILRADSAAIDAEFAAAEAATKELEQKRRDLTELARKVELEAFQHRRRVAVTTEKDALLMRQVNSSRLSAFSARTVTGMFLQAGERVSDAAATMRQEFDEYTRRLDAAKHLAAELQRDCEENEAGLRSKTKEREDLAATVEQLQRAVAHLEQNELVVDDAVKHTQQLLRSAGATYHEIPSLQRAIRSNEARLAVLHLERESLVSTLMTLVEKDDEKIRRLQMTCVRSAGSVVMPGVVKDLTAENEHFQRLCFSLIEEAEKERLRLDGSAKALAEKLQFVEEKIKLKVPSQQPKAANSKGGIRD
jgi:DNA repair exonuclease SbcCD ATPase subunit